MGPRARCLTVVAADERVIVVGLIACRNLADAISITHVEQIARS
jgi:hypothetical protein